MSNARSPREVCSITIGINGLMASPLNCSCIDWSFQTAARQSPFGLTVTPQAASRWLLAAGGPQFRLCLGRFLVGRPNFFSRTRDLDRNALRFGRHAVERLAQTEVAAQRLLAAVAEDLLDRFVRVVALKLGLLADQFLDLLVADLEAELVGDRLEHELARDRQRRLGSHALDELVGRLPGELEVRLGADAPALERAAQPVQQLARPRLDE